MSAAPFHFRDSYLPALERRGPAMPAAAEALNREGRRLRERGEISAAIAKHQEALRLKLDAAATHQNLALAWWRRGNLPEALAAYRRVMELRPKSATAHSDYLYALYHDADATPPVLIEEARRWASRFGGNVGITHTPEARSEKHKERRLRVGYVSADFRRHTLRHFIMPLLKHHDRQAVEVFCYSNVGEPDRVTELVQPLADQWRDVKGIKGAELAELIRREGIDILVDLSGHMGGNRLTTFALRPAPVQVQIYFAGTSGLPQMDYRITDAYSDPSGMTEQFHAEKLVRLPACAWPYEPEENTPNVGPLPAISNGHITFGSMNRPIKISEQMVDLWSRVLRAVPNSKLMFLADAVASDVEYHYQRFARHDIGPDRLIHWPERRGGNIWRRLAASTFAWIPFPMPATRLLAMRCGWACRR